MMTKPKMITDEEAIDHIVRVTGKTRRQARMMLAQKMASGEIRAEGLNPYTEKREMIPKEAWQYALKLSRKFYQ